MKKDTPNVDMRLENIEKAVFRIENTLEKFAISVKNQFDIMDNKFDSIEEKINTKADKNDIKQITRFFNGHENRISRLEDNMHVVRGKLNFEG